MKLKKVYPHIKHINTMITTTNPKAIVPLLLFGFTIGKIWQYGIIEKIICKTSYKNSLLNFQPNALYIFIRR